MLVPPPTLHILKGVRKPRFNVAIDDGVPIVDGVRLVLDGLRDYSIVGQGANAAVFAAHESVLDRRVAVKIYARVIEGDRRDKIKQARAEVRKLGRLRHPGLIVPFNYREVEGHGVLVMEFVDGPTLREWLISGRSFEERLRVLSLTFRALLAAHKVGCLHGDFHWENVLIGERGIPKIVDFGTSLFAGTRAGTTPSREADRVLKLTEQVLPEAKGLNIVDRASLAGSPSLTLATCDALSELTDLLRILDNSLKYNPDGKPSPKVVHRFATVATLGPGLDLRRMVAVLEARGFTTNMVTALLDYVSTAIGYVLLGYPADWLGPLRKNDAKRLDCPPPDSILAALKSAWQIRELNDHLVALERAWQKFRERQKQLPYIDLPVVRKFPYAGEWGQGDPDSE